MFGRTHEAIQGMCPVAERGNDEVHAHRRVEGLCERFERRDECINFDQALLGRETMKKFT